MDNKQMKILIIEDDANACNDFINCIKSREDINLIGITDSDMDALKYVKLHHPEGIVLDIELIIFFIEMELILFSIKIIQNILVIMY